MALVNRLTTAFGYIFLAMVGVVGRRPANRRGSSLECIALAARMAAFAYQLDGTLCRFATGTAKTLTFFQGATTRWVGTFLIVSHTVSSSLLGLLLYLVCVPEMGCRNPVHRWLKLPSVTSPSPVKPAFLKAQRWRCMCNFRVRPVHPTSMPLIIILVLLLLLFGGGGYYMGPGLGYYGGGGLSIVLLIIILFLLFGRGRSRL
jgi:hypothetical protein